MLIDYHVHNHFSPDSDSGTVEIIKNEIKNGVSHICITNHAEDFTEGKGMPGVFHYERALERFKKTGEEIVKLRPDYPQMTIGFGAEIQYQEEYMDVLKQFIKKTPFDFILGSVHIVDGILISADHFIDELFGKMDEMTAYTKYFETMLRWVEWGQMDAIAHFDIIKKFGVQYYGPFKPKKYKPILLKILETMKRKGIGMELNTGSLHKNCKELFPHPDILKWCVEIGVDHFTLGSDAHEVNLTGKYIPEAFAIAKKVGIPTLSTYQKRKPTKHAI